MTLMNRRTIHKNLSTSFVDINALVRYLREMQFVGSIHIELCGYEAEIMFTQSNRLQARETDHAAGSTKQGLEAFRRILIKAREPHGRVHVYQSISANGSNARKVHVDAAIAASAMMTVSSVCDSPATHLIPKTEAKPGPGDDWDAVLTLTAELLQTVDRSLERAGIPFSRAFENACAIVAAECPFIDPNRGLFEYSGGSVRMGTVVSRQRFLNAVLKALGRIFDRLREDPKYSRLHIFTAYQVRALMQSRKEAYESLGFSSGLKALLDR